MFQRKISVPAKQIKRSCNPEAKMSKFSRTFFNVLELGRRGGGGRAVL